MPSLHHRPTHRQQRRNSTSSSSSDDDDMITPCPLEKQEPTVQHEEVAHRQQQQPQQRPQPQKQSERPKSWLETEAATEDPVTLWKSMLAIQRAFGCYNSARMRAAVEMDGEEEHVRKFTVLPYLL
jgi:hypothetical protein